jgi:hypothetical protein
LAIAVSHKKGLMLCGMASSRSADEGTCPAEDTHIIEVLDDLVTNIRGTLPPTVDGHQFAVISG